MSMKLKSRGPRNFAAIFIMAMLFAGASMLFAQSNPPANEKKNEKKTEKSQKPAAKKKDPQNEIFKVWMKGKSGKEKSKDKSKAADKGDSKIKLKNPGPGTRSGSGTGGGSGAPNTTPADSRLLGSDDRPSFVMSILQFLGVMALMLGGFYYGVRFLKSRSATLGGTGDLVRVIASVPLMQGKFLQIVDMAGKLLVLGVSDHGVNLIAEIEDARTVDQIRIWESRKNAGPMPQGLMEQLTRVLKTTEYRFWGKRENSRPDAPDFQALLHERGGRVPDEPSEPEGLDAAAVAPAPRSDSNQDANQNMLFGDASGDDNPGDVGLQKLLNVQKRKLAAMKSKSGTE